ncbi:MAG: type I secretion system permease/ATPase [Desulfobulbaceae bacterium]|nr:MAG: type I secretion system permease/ATPase [Desulfobulbaceae bacterium]
MVEQVKVGNAGQWQISDDSDSFDDPLIDCIEIIARIHDRPISRTVLRAGLPLVNNRLTIELVSRATRRAGMASRILKRPLAEFRGYELPAIIILEGHRACVAVEAHPEEGTMRVIWPESQGSQVISIDELTSIYSGYTIFIRPKYRIDHGRLAHPVDRTKNWFWGTIFSSWRIYRDVLVASFLINVFALATPFFIINAYDRVIPNAAFETLWVLGGGIAIIYIFELVLRGLRGYFIDTAGKKSNLVLSSILMEKVFGLRMEARPKSVGSFTKQLQQFESIRDFITSFSITALVDLPFALLAIFAIWYIGGKVVLICIACILLILLYAFLVQIPLKKSVGKSFQAEAQKNSILVEGLSGIETIKILGAESRIQRAWEESVSYIANWSARTRFLSSSVAHVSHFLQSLSVVLVIIASVYIISKGQMTGGGLIACVLLSRRATSPMTQVVSLMTRYHQARNALGTLNRIMQLPSERPPEMRFLHRAEFNGAITLQNLSFTYPGSSTEVLKNINLQINPGERVGIIGPIGSGKTTLGKLILGLYQPTKGMVAMDGTDIRQIDPAELRNFIGYVPQDVVLFQGTVRDNIVLGANDADDSAVLRAAQIAGVSGFVERHPMGYDMPVEEQGRNLSGGQRQAISIARAILLDPPVLVMDEPTSSMDNRSESLIRARLLKILENKTTIIITHRTSLLEIVDRVVVLSNETIVADGTRAYILEALKNGHLAL